MEIKQTYEIKNFPNRFGNHYKKWVAVDDLLEHFQKYKDKLSKSTHKVDIKLRVYINSWMNELLEKDKQSSSNNKTKELEN